MPVITRLMSKRGINTNDLGETSTKQAKIAKMTIEGASAVPVKTELVSRFSQLCFEEKVKFIMNLETRLHIMNERFIYRKILFSYSEYLTLLKESFHNLYRFDQEDKKFFAVEVYHSCFGDDESPLLNLLKTFKRKLKIYSPGLSMTSSKEYKVLHPYMRSFIYPDCHQDNNPIDTGIHYGEKSINFFEEFIFFLEKYQHVFLAIQQGINIHIPELKDFFDNKSNYLEHVRGDCCEELYLQTESYFVFDLSHENRVKIKEFIEQYQQIFDLGIWRSFLTLQNLAGSIVQDAIAKKEDIQELSIPTNLKEFLGAKAQTSSCLQP